jgi:hypothetical protein
MLATSKVAPANFDEREDATAETEPLKAAASEPMSSRFEDALANADRFMAELKSRRPVEIPLRVEREKEIRQVREVVRQEPAALAQEPRTLEPPRPVMPRVPRERERETPIVSGGAVIGRLTVEVASPPAAAAKHPATPATRTVVVRGGQAFQSRLGTSSRFGLGQL